MFFRKKRKILDLTYQVETLTEQMQQQQTTIQKLTAQLEEYQQREYSISRAITDAAQTASRIIDDAQKESDDIHDAAQQAYMASQKQGEELVQTAYENARDIVKDAEQTSQKKIQDTDQAISAYVELLNQFNETMKAQAQQAQEHVKKLSEYYARLNTALPDLFSEVPHLNTCLQSAPVEEPLPDPAGDPGQLMRNIYTIEQRSVLKEQVPDRTSTPPEPEKKPAEKKPEPAPTAAPVPPKFAPEDGGVVRVSDIVKEDLGTMDTEELIETVNAIGNIALGDME